MSNRTEHMIGDCKYAVDHDHKKVYIEESYADLDAEGFQVKKTKFRDTNGSYDQFMKATKDPPVNLHDILSQTGLTIDEAVDSLKKAALAKQKEAERAALKPAS
jgi:hypothetical protein